MTAVVASRHARLLISGAAVALLVSSAAGCRKDEAVSHGAPAQVANARPEADLATVTLTEQAERRLGIATARAEQRDVPRTRTVGGEVTVPPGRAILVAAPLAGTLMAPEAGAPQAGAQVDAGQAMFRLLVLPGDATVSSAREALSVAQAQAQLARARLERIRTLRASNLSSDEELENAVAAQTAAEAALQAARARLALIEGGPSESVALALPPLPIASPVRGIVRRLHAAPGQRVAAGSALFDVEDHDKLWVRVPVYVGDLRDIDATAPVSVRNDAAAGANVVLTAVPVRAPPSADPLAASADLFYEVRGPSPLRPGQRVSAQLPLKGRERRLVVPAAAVLYDINGGTWVYEQTAPHVYVRRRVEIDHVAGNLAVLARGPAPGTVVVTAGAAELFGTEFGTGK